MQRTSFLQLRYGRGSVLEPFLVRVYGEARLRAVYWISPWLTHLHFPTGNTRDLLRKVRHHNANLVLITREPERGTRHEEFVRDTLAIPTATVFYMPTLHAKFYVATAHDQRYALLGSANMYEWSNRSYEVGIVIDARGEGEVLVNKLEDLAIELRLSKHTTHVQEIRK